VHDQIFAQAYPMARRAAGVRSAAAVALTTITWIDREDLEQEVMLGIWLALPRFNQTRGGLRTFTERVIANRLRSALRKLHCARCAFRKAVPLDGVESVVAAQTPCVDLRMDLRRVLATVSASDRAAAWALVESSPTDAARRLRTSRAAIYRAIGRLRFAFASAGLAPMGHCDGTRRERRDLPPVSHTANSRAESGLSHWSAPKASR
jgi:DNA-directed RNA polymerase specialized sigma24 family protein